MPEQMWEIGASGWVYYKEIFYDARSHERKKNISSVIHETTRYL
jgi:hypothetical protein